MAYKSYKGTYYLKNPSKYIGKGSNPEYKSHYEQVTFRWMDLNQNIMRWGYEVVGIPYKNSVDNNIHTYWPDIYAEILINKEIKKFLIEIKPTKDLIYPPNIVMTNKNKKAYVRVLNEKLTFVKNVDKFKAAAAYCKTLGYVFRILTEKDIF